MESDELDALIEGCAIQGIVAGGSHLRREDNMEIASKVCGNILNKSHDPSSNIWTKEEMEFLRDNIGHMSMREIGEHLGRSENAVMVRSVRNDMPTATCFPGYITVEKLSKILRVDSHTINLLRKRGLIDTQVAKTKHRKVNVVSIKYIYRWATRPRNWLYFKADRIRDPHLRSLVLRAQALWDDEWWTPGQVAAYWGINIAVVNDETNKGRLKGVRWANWWYLKSDVVKHNFFRGTGRQWSPRADAWILKARDELNMMYKDIAIRMKGNWTLKMVTYRYNQLKKKANQGD